MSLATHKYLFADPYAKALVQLLRLAQGRLKRGCLLRLEGGSRIRVMAK
jgi:hypothetical protein